MTRKRDYHPLYESVPPEHRWRGGSLVQLFVTLTAAAKRRGEPSRGEREADKDWSWLVLPAGAIVAMRVRHDQDNRLELRIARKSAPDGDGWRAKWEQEVATFLKHFEIEATAGDVPCRLPGRQWHRHLDEKDRPHVRLIELRHGEVKVHWAHCHRCKTEHARIEEVYWHPGGGIEGQACQGHAMMNGREEAERRDRDRQMRLMP